MKYLRTLLSNKSKFKNHIYETDYYLIYCRANVKSTKKKDETRCIICRVISINSVRNNING